VRTPESAPRIFDALLGVEGLGPKTLRASALVAELVSSSVDRARGTRRHRSRHYACSRMLASELEGILNAHAFLRVERPPLLWEPDTELEPFIRALGEMIAAGLVRNGHELSEITLNVSNVTVEADAAGPMPAGDFVAVTIESNGDWGPEATWDPSGEIGGVFISGDVESALDAAGAAWAYTRKSAPDAGSVTVLYRRAGRGPA
jgi:hypothetical protein